MTRGLCRTEDELLRVGWGIIALDLVDVATKMVLSVDRDELDTQLMQPGKYQEQDLGHQINTSQQAKEANGAEGMDLETVPLVSPKLAALCTYLLSYKVRPDPSISRQCSQVKFSSSARHSCSLQPSLWLDQPMDSLLSISRDLEGR